MAQFRDVKVIYRSSNGERAWMVEVDRTSPLPLLVADLVEALSIGGKAEDYEVQNEGSLEEPVLVLIPKTGRHIGRIRDIGDGND